jgi:hypothetical protein
MDHQLRGRRFDRWRWWELRDTLGHRDYHRYFQRCEPLCFPEFDSELIGRRMGSFLRLSMKNSNYSGAPRFAARSSKQHNPARESVSHRKDGRFKQPIR